MMACVGRTTLDHEEEDTRGGWQMNKMEGAWLTDGHKEAIPAAGASLRRWNKTLFCEASFCLCVCVFVCHTPSET